MKRNALIAPLCCLALCSAPRVGNAQSAVLAQDVFAEKEEAISTPYAAGSALVSGFNVMSLLNTRTADESPKWGYMGVLGGVLGMGLGGASLVQDPSGEAKPLAIANIAIGAVATFSAMSAIRRAKRDEAEDQPVSVSGHEPMHFKAGVVGHGLGLQLKF